MKFDPLRLRKNFTRIKLEKQNKNLCDQAIKKV